MKTVLPQAIGTIEEAKAYLTELYNNREAYHPEDSASDCLGRNGKATPEECTQLDKLMEDIYNLPGNDDKPHDEIAFCPCEFILNLDPDYRSAQGELRAAEMYPANDVMHDYTLTND